MKMEEGLKNTIMDEMYDSISEDLVEIITDPSVSDFITILHLLCTVSNMVEFFYIGEKPMKGMHKKDLVLSFARNLVEKHSDMHLRENLLQMFDECGDTAVETIIGFAKTTKVMKVKLKKNCDGCLSRCN